MTRNSTRWSLERKEHTSKYIPGILIVQQSAWRRTTVRTHQYPAAGEVFDNFRSCNAQAKQDSLSHTEVSLPPTHLHAVTCQAYH